MISMIFKLLLSIHAFRPSQQECNVRKAESQLSCDDKKKVLNYFNDRRSQVASGKTKLPKSKDMWVLKWDDELAKIAQDYSFKCKWEVHNDKLPDDVGETISLGINQKEERADLVYLSQLWYNEINKFDWDGTANFSETGHFTQMVWADTKFIGCGVCFYYDGSSPKTPYHTLFVCDYKPAGNYKGEKPYSVLKGDRVCSRGVQSKVFAGLCAHDQGHADGKYEPCSSLYHIDYFHVI